MADHKTGPDHARLDRVVAEARRAADERAKGYREQVLKIYPWVCGRCGRDFTHANLQLLEVHHRDHNHDNNPVDGSNWESCCAPTATRMNISVCSQSTAETRSHPGCPKPRRLRISHSRT
jgi:hypothetical protein